MTHLQKQLIAFMLTGHYMRAVKTRSDRNGYRVYDKNHNPVISIKAVTARRLSRIWLFKKDKNARLTFDLRLVRTLRKNHTIRVQYLKQFHNEKIYHSGRHIKESTQ